MAILDEIQRLVPGYDVSRANLLAGNTEHTSLHKSAGGVTPQKKDAPNLDFSRRTTHCLRQAPWDDTRGH